MPRRDNDIFKKLNNEKPLAKSSSGLGQKMPERSTFDLLLEKQQSTARKKPTPTRNSKVPKKKSSKTTQDLDVFTAMSKSSTKAKDALHDIDYGNKPNRKKADMQPQIGASEASKRTAAPKKTQKKKRTEHTDALKFAENAGALDYNEDKLSKAMSRLELGAEPVSKSAKAPKKPETPKRAASPEKKSKPVAKKEPRKLESPISSKTPEQADKPVMKPQKQKSTAKQQTRPAHSSISTSSMARTKRGSEDGGVNKVFRHENKYYINYKDHVVLQTALSAVMRLDENADEYGGYHIRSLYFDDIYETALAEKVAGTDDRCKYRVRIYNYSDGIIKLEKKQKLGKFIKKTSMNLTREECNSLVAGDCGFLLGKDNKLAREVYLMMRTRLLKPKVIVDYWREAYVYPIEDVRVTFDIDLKGSTMLTDIFDPNTPVLPALDNGIMVLEVKFNKYLPESIKCALNSVGAAKRSAISKYVLCRKYD